MRCSLKSAARGVQGKSSDQEVQSSTLALRHLCDDWPARNRRSPTRSHPRAAPATQITAPRACVRPSGQHQSAAPATQTAADAHDPEGDARAYIRPFGQRQSAVPTTQIAPAQRRRPRSTRAYIRFVGGWQFVGGSLLVATGWWQLVAGSLLVAIGWWQFVGGNWLVEVCWWRVASGRREEEEGGAVPH